MPLTTEYNEKIADLASSKQLEKYKAYCEHGSYRKAAKAINLNHKTVQESLKRLEKLAADSGLIGTYSPVDGCSSGRNVKKVTTHVKNGQIVQEWVRTDTDKIAIDEYVRIVIDSLKDTIPVSDVVVPAPNYTMDDLMSVYPLGDPHLGMYSWAEETGADFDCNICETLISKSMDRLVETQPKSRTGRVENMGDFFHSDNERAITERSGNHLDVDGRWGRVLRIGVRMMIYCIKKCLEKHEIVEVINVPGNHDDRTSYCLSIALAEHFRNEPRVHVDTTYTSFFFKEFGLNLIGANHGQVKPQRLYEVMTVDQAEAWGRTKFRTWHCGHIHHERVVEIGGVKIEYFRSMKAKDSYEARSGYRSDRDMKAILYHKEFGEIERHTCNLAAVMKG